MFYATLCEIISEDKILLKRASRGVSKGKWNGLGGKIERGESPIDNVLREVNEEAGIKIKDPKMHGSIIFYQGSYENIFGIVYLFSARDFEGEVKQGEEGELRWFSIDSIPYHEMWPDDAIWLPYVLEGKRFNAEFLFDKNMKNIIYYKINFV
ncbi:MAG: 8-oxo-dGTP diphosphatase [Candidatus Aenigmatarchaeota archaeon]